MSNERDPILVVDDNPTNLKVLFDYLSGQNYEIFVAEDGESAIEQAQFCKPFLILLDVMMPGIDGFETCRRLKEIESTREIPVIFMTALADTPYIIKGFSVGGVDYLTKPLQQEEVFVRVRNHISIRKMQRMLELEIELRCRVEQELRELNAGKDRLFTILAHDLKNPLNGIFMSSENLVPFIESGLTQEAVKMARLLNDSAHQMGRVISDLMDWAQTQVGTLEVKITPLNLSRIINDNIALYMHTAHQKNISIENLLPEGFAASGDGRFVDTVVRNLLNNALKFTDAGGSIVISGNRENGKARLHIKDTGIGMGPETLADLFKVGGSKSKPGTQGEQGTGLGLLLCHELVQKCAGRLWAESVQGKGSTFSFELPAS